MHFFYFVEEEYTVSELDEKRTFANEIICLLQEHGFKGMSLQLENTIHLIVHEAFESGKEFGLNVSFEHSPHVGIYRNAYHEISEDYSYDENPKNLFPCYSIILEKDGKKIFYSGDTKFVSWWEVKDFDRFYVDTCMADYYNNVHYNVNQMYKDIMECDESIIPEVWCMHFDSDEAIDRAKALGFNVVEIE